MMRTIGEVWSTGQWEKRTRHWELGLPSRSEPRNHGTQHTEIKGSLDSCYVLGRSKGVTQEVSSYRLSQPPPRCPQAEVLDSEHRQVYGFSSTPIRNFWKGFMFMFSFQEPSSKPLLCQKCSPGILACECPSYPVISWCEHLHLETNWIGEIGPSFLSVSRETWRMMET